MASSSHLARFRLGAAAALALGCSGSDLLLPSASQPAAIALAAGDGQSGVAGGILPESLAVRITDATARPVAQIRVAFTADAGGGRTEPDTAVTDNTGRAAARWVLGTQAGTHKVQANVVGSTQLAASFTATVSAGTAAKFQLASGDAQTAPAGTTLASPLVVKATDAQGNPVAGIVVAWSATGGGTVTPATNSTGADGTASAQRALGPAAGAQGTVADAGDVPGSPVTFSATATTGSAGQLSITTQPSASATVGQPLAVQPQIQLRDNLGNPVAQAGIAVTAAIASGPVGGTLSGQLTQATNANGLATFVDLTLGGAVGTYTLGFSGANLAAVTSAQISVTSGAPSASRSSVTASPGTIGLGSNSTVTVTVRDALGNLMGGINVVPSADDPSGGFTPQQATTAANGVATFSFTGTKARTYTISAKAAGVTIAQTASVQVTKIQTTTTITSDNPDPSLLTQAVTVTFTVTAAAATPTGTVTVSDGQVSCSATVAAGQCQLTPITAGTRTLTASYPGSDTFAASSGTASHQVTLVPTTTAIVAESPDPSFPTQPVLVQFIVSSVLGTPAGTVTVSDGSASCSASVGTGQCTLTPTSAGNKTLTATYAGQSPFAGSSGTAPHQVVLAPTTTQLSSSLNPAPQGQTVVFTAQVTSTFRTVGSGSVLFGDGGACPTPTTVLGTKSVNSSGVATLSKKNLTVGTHTILACYQGTTTFAPSASAPLSQQITSTK
ncbi:MAG: Ig-like domain repeat protein [Gemmatimonadota bacterium]